MIFCDISLDACAGSFHHFVVPLPPGGRLAMLGEPPQLGGHPHSNHPFISRNSYYSKTAETDKQIAHPPRRYKYTVIFFP